MRTVTEIGPPQIGLPPYLRDLVPPSDLPPIPVADVRTFLRSDGPFDIDVMANDSDPEGLTLTLLSADALHGTASVNPDGTVAYTPPLAPELADTITYVIQDPGGLTSPGTVTITLSDPQISADVSVENTITISATDGIVDITITAPPVFAGDYQMDTADLAAGPVNLAPPDVSGTPTIGGTLSVQDGLWVYDATGTEPVITWQWLRDGADIIGATSESYVLTATDSGTDISVRETATDALGSRSAASPTVSVAAAAGVAATFLSGAASGGTASQSSEILSVDLSGHNGVDDIVIMLERSGAHLRIR